MRTKYSFQENMSWAKKLLELGMIKLKIVVAIEVLKMYLENAYWKTKVAKTIVVLEECA